MQETHQEQQISTGEGNINEITQSEYPYTEDADGNLTITLLTGSFEIFYKLYR